jgi:hypothetical protein
MILRRDLTDPVLGLAGMENSFVYLSGDGRCKVIISPISLNVHYVTMAHNPHRPESLSSMTCQSILSCLGFIKAQNIKEAGFVKGISKFLVPHPFAGLDRYEN